MSAPRAALVDTRPVDAATAAAIESAEARGWADLVAAAPRPYADRLGLRAQEVGGALVLQCAGGGFDRGLFNRPIGLGVVAPASFDVVQDIVAGYRAAGISRFMLMSQPHCRPREYETWLGDLGLQPNGSWDRIVRDDAPLNTDSAHASDRDIAVSRVDGRSARVWAEYVSEVYGLDAVPWLLGLHGRRGWYHYLAHEEGRPVGARSMYLPDAGRPAFLAVDGPVPGVMTSDHAPDAAICRAIVADGLALGASGFVADIEAPSPGRDTPAYRNASDLGFRVPYTRTHHMAQLFI
jgi:hypothetical protein